MRGDDGTIAENPCVVTFSLKILNMPKYIFVGGDGGVID